jgi:hypothetical protein
VAHPNNYVLKFLNGKILPNFTLETAIKEFSSKNNFKIKIFNQKCQIPTGSRKIIHQRHQKISFRKLIKPVDFYKFFLIKKSLTVKKS